MFRSLKNDAVYRKSRSVRDERGRVVRGDRGWRGASKKTERARAAQVTNWITHEFATQRRLCEAGADVPYPLAQIGNAVLMDYIGDDEEAAPLLREVDLSEDEARPLFDAILRNIELFLCCDRVHGDLSEYNILYWQGTATIIDFAQAVDPRYNPDEVYPLLARDIERVCRYFGRYGITAEPVALSIDLWTRYLTGGLDY
jgi:RIO kinase 1